VIVFAAHGAKIEPRSRSVEGGGGIGGDLKPELWCRNS
jgi:hypothetical protein